MLFIDVVLDIDPGRSAKGYKNFTYNEWYFPAHFDGDPNVPGSILSETMSQFFLIALLTSEGLSGEIANSSKISELRFKRQVVPGDRVYFKAEVLTYKRGIAKGYIEGTIEDELVCYQNVEIVVPSVLENYSKQMTPKDNHE